MKNITGINPILYTDYPDPDVIRVEDTYYMVSTTMHFMPGCVILRSFDLVNWEIASYVYDRLDSTEGQCLKDGKGVYGKGMWAATIRYHKGTFYICFVANDTHKTYIYRSESIEGPWRKNVIEGVFFHDSSILFDDDGRVYIAYGNRNIYITELNEDLTAVKEGGLHRLAVADAPAPEIMLGYEGSHFYKINGKYYLTFIHWPRGSYRTESCFVADSIEGEFTGKDVLCSDLDNWNSGTAQGGLVDTPDGEWYAIVFQDHGAVGRIPVLVPVTFENDFPVFGVDGKAPKEVKVKSTRPDYVYAPLNCNDDFNYVAGKDGKVELKKPWQWNHEPNDNCWSVTEKPGSLLIRTDKLSPNLVQAQNTLTQRTFGPYSSAEVTVDASGIKEGDVAGLCALMGSYGLIGITKENGAYKLVNIEKAKLEKPAGMGSFDDQPGVVMASCEGAAQVTFKMECDFTKENDTVTFYYKFSDASEYKQLGVAKKMFFTLDHFTGCRFGLFNFSTKEIGGEALFTNFIYNK